MSDINFSKLTWENLPARTTALSATNLNRIENGINDSVNGVNANAHSIAELNTRIGQIASGTPEPAELVSQMTEHNKIYVYTGSEPNYTAGNWYFWNGSAWTSGGTYGGAVTDTTLSVSGAAADAKAVGDALAGKADADDVTAIEGDVESLTEDIADLKDDLKNVNERFVLEDVPLYDGYDNAVIFDSLEFGQVSGKNGQIVYYNTIRHTDIISVDKATDAVYCKLDLSTHKVGICMYKNGAWVRNTGWYSNPLSDQHIKLSTLSDDFDGIRLQYGFKAERPLTADDDREFVNTVSIRRGSNTILADFNTIKTDSIKYINTIAPIAESANNLLANINDNVVLNGSPTYFNDTPTGKGGSFVNIRYTSGYNEQLFFENVTGHRYERVVSRTGTIYRDWTLDTRSRFVKKKVYCTGDSIMWGRTDADGRATLTIPNNIASRFPVTVTNAAVGGDCIAHRSDGASVYDRITQVDLSSYDYVVINGGTNDYGFGTPMGTIDSTDVSTFYGAYKAILEYIFSENSYMRVMLITPTFRNYVAQGGSWHYGNSYSMQGDGGYTMDEMCDAIIAIGKKYNIPVYDSRKGSPINDVNYETTLELTSGATDRYLHPSDNSYKLYGDSIASFFGDVF